MNSEGTTYTKGTSFRALAESHARKYRANVLKLEDYDRYGHLLEFSDGKKGSNFLPSMKSQIEKALKQRRAQGKGIGYKRTVTNLLSSQAMCFNLLVPLLQNKKFAVDIFNPLIGNVSEIISVDIEYTPPNSIFNDQSTWGGVDCDALITYRNEKNDKAIITVETKYVETEFSKCSYRKKKREPECLYDTILDQDFLNCLYKSKKGYRYWDVAKNSGLYKMDDIIGSTCQFGKELWQLFTNMTLAYAIAEEDRSIQDYKFIVICPKGNKTLSDDGRLFDDFRKFLFDPNKFQVLYLENIMDLLKEHSKGGKHIWINEFTAKYDIR